MPAQVSNTPAPGPAPTHTAIAEIAATARTTPHHKKCAISVAGRRRRVSKRKTLKVSSSRRHGDSGKCDVVLAAEGGNVLNVPLPPPLPAMKALSKKRAPRLQGKKDPKRFNKQNKYKSGKQNRSDRRSAQRNTSF